KNESIGQYVARRVRALRAGYGTRGISQEALARGLAIAPNTVSRWEAGRNTPNIEIIEKLARFFGVGIYDLLPGPRPEPDTAIEALLRAAKKLTPKDVEELRRYAEFRHARTVYHARTPGRRRKAP